VRAGVAASGHGCVGIHEGKRRERGRLGDRDRERQRERERDRERDVCVCCVRCMCVRVRTLQIDLYIAYLLQFWFSLV